MLRGLGLLYPTRSPFIEGERREKKKGGEERGGEGRGGVKEEEGD